MTLANTNNIEAESFLSPDTSDGFYTVASWWVTQERKAFNLLLDPQIALAEEEARVAQRSNEAGAKVVLVAPSPRAKASGRRYERAYPKWLLRECYSLSP